MTLIDLESNGNETEHYLIGLLDCVVQATRQPETASVQSSLTAGVVGPQRGPARQPTSAARAISPALAPKVSMPNEPSDRT